MSLKLENPEKLLAQCRIVLIDVLEHRKLGFESFKKTGNCLVFELNSDVISRAEAKYTFKVLPFVQSKNGLFYWIGITVEFQFIAGYYYFREACIVIFEGMAADNMKQPILRAEWAEHENSRSSHAQPHWHVYPSFINKNIVSLFDEEPLLADFDPVDDDNVSNEVTTPEWEEGSKFHFAMASKWHQEGKNAQVEIIDEKRLLNWLKGCVFYTKEQLLYIEK